MTAVKPAPLDDQLEFAKWIALIAMACDHIGLRFSDIVDYHTFRAVGRITWPLLAWIIGVRLMQNPARATGYLKRLIPWAIITQPVYWLCFYPVWFETGLPRSIFSTPLNVFFTIALGVMLFKLWNDWDVKRSVLARTQIVLLSLIILVLSAYPVGGQFMSVDYGPIAVAMIPVAAIAARTSLTKAALLMGVLAVLANTYAMNTMHNPTMTAIIIIMPLVAGLVGVLCLTGAQHLPRLPRWFFYFYYPAHMVLLLLVRILIPIKTMH